MDGNKNGTIASMADIRVALSNSLRGLEDGTVTPATANAKSNTVGKMLASVRLELDYYKSIGKTPNIEMMLGGQPALPAAESNVIAAKAKA